MAREGVGFLTADESAFGLVGQLVMVRQTLLSLKGELQLLTRFQKLTRFSLVRALVGF